MRDYDVTLVEDIRARQRSERVFGMDVAVRPVPDAEPHSYDPRMLPIARRNLAASSGQPRGKLSLLAMRSHKGADLRDLSNGSFDFDERLIEVGGTHFIGVYVLRPERACEGCPVMVYLHGGNFNAGDIETYMGRMRLIAERSASVVVFPAYRLAPECPFPGPVEDCHAAVEWAWAHAGDYGADPARLMVAGDSAGGSLACACAQLDLAGRIQRLALVYPAVDCGDWRTQANYTWSWDAYQVSEGQRDLMVAAINSLKDLFDLEVEGRMNLYMQRNGSLRDPLMSACFASDAVLSRFPPTLMVTAEYDFMRVAGEWFASKLASLGVSSACVRYEGVEHGFSGMLGILPQAEDLCDLLAGELCVL